MASEEYMELSSLVPNPLIEAGGVKPKRFKTTKVNFRDDAVKKWCSEKDVHHQSSDLEVGLPDRDDFEYDENQLTTMTLPAEFVRRPSMTSIRMKRDQLFQGTRTRRNPRVIFKNGRRNTTFRKIPERSIRFAKDFVTTLVSKPLV